MTCAPSAPAGRVVNTGMLTLMIVAPLIGALVLTFAGRRLGERLTGVVACLSVAVAAGCAFAAFFLKLPPAAPDAEGVRRVTERLGTWFSVGSFSADFGLVLDPLSGVMALFITGVGLLIHIFATGYMHGDDGYGRFFAALNLFVAAMLTLVLADNLLLMFVGWEGVGVCSYLLIGHYFTRDEAADAARKAFVYNRIGDVGIVLGTLLLFTQAGSVNFADISRWAAQQPVEALGWAAVGAGGLTTVGLLLLLGATGKSAQIPLFVWLPDAMAGPTPVSALIHAATMVTAGVYLLVRLNVVFLHAPTALAVTAAVGAATALLAATIALGQDDIKKVLAYSTVSQLGLMVMACGAGAFTAGLFHVTTHAFFKALLFLGAGSVIHALHEEQSLRRMGGLKKFMPATYWTMTVGWLAIAGFPPLSGFFSKDEILFETFASAALPGGLAKTLWAVGLLTSFLTAFYMTRLMVLTFHGEPREAVAHGQPRESPLVMTAPLVALALLSAFGGALGLPEAFGLHPWMREFLSPLVVVPSELAHKTASHTLELILMGVSTGVALSGVAAGWFFFGRQPLWEAPRVLQAKCWVDEAYEAAIARPLMRLAERGLWMGLDASVVDGLVSGVGRSLAGLGATLREMQSGYARGYVVMIFIAALLILSYFVFGQG
ncbi:MAG: NADH-quinone oxidoreductase subunit L [Chloracidobacterium sp. CP2_5A]|nr:MAG: NADH-quinone oxidoreductase subunit L [Chloracidobacterium sp. CP2_5A]